jgi:ABC-type glycerol-3-phosphate transport system substrate-binding protein
VDLVQGIGVAPAPAQAGGTGTAMGYRQAFQSGIAAMTLDGSFIIPEHAKITDLDFGAVLVPKGTTRGVWVSVDAWGISSQTKYKDIAWDVTKALGDLDAGMYMTQYGTVKTGAIPVYKSVANNPQWKGQNNEFLNVALKQLAYGKLELAFKNNGTWYWTNLPSGLQDIVINKKDPKTALDQMVKIDNAEFFGR